MGWWKDDAGRLLGDDAVDVFEDALGRLRSVRNAAGHPLPTLQQLLDALQRALSLPAGGFTSDRRGVTALVAVRAPAAASLRSSGAEPPPDLWNATLEALDAVALAYERSGATRRPTVDEVVGTIDFSLSVRPERFLAPEPGVKLARIELEP